MNIKYNRLSPELFESKKLDVDKDEIDKIDNKYMNELSTNMSIVITFLKEHLKDKLFILHHKYHGDDEDIEFVETNMFLFHMVTENKKVTLFVNINIKIDINTVAYFGLRTNIGAFEYYSATSIINNTKRKYNYHIS